MFGFLNRIFRFRNRRGEERGPDELSYERWTADFSNPEHIRFSIKSENSHDANMRKRGRGGALVLSLKKSGCLAWIENPLYRYADLVLEGRIHLDARGSYAASGFMFRMVDESTYYSALVSSKGYFRLDLVRNGNPLALIGWTEVPGGLPEAESGEGGQTFTLTIAANGNRIVIAINSLWAAEVRDSAIPGGRICFMAASYETPASCKTRPGEAAEASPGAESPSYTAEAFLEALTVESRIAEVEAAYGYWSADDAPSDPQSHIRLAETFAAMGQPDAALEQIRLGWEKAAGSAPGGDSASHRGARELLLAARLALHLDRFAEAEEYADACLGLEGASAEKREAFIEKARLLYRTRRFAELKAHCETAAAGFGDDADLLFFLGHAFWELAEYDGAAAAYDRAFEADGTNGLAAKNAANVWELLGDREKALDRCLKAGRAFLAEGNYADLGTVVAKALALDADNWEVHALAGKWAFGIEDWAAAKAEFEEAERLRLRPPATADDAASPSVPPHPDPALVFLRGLLLVREGKRAEALPFLEEVALLESGYPLFRFRLAENRFLLSGDAGDPKFRADLDAALSLDPENGWAHNLAAQAALARNDTEEAARRLDEALRLLGEEPAVRLNQADLLARQGRTEEALVLLDASPGEDPGGIMAHYAGNILFREGRFEEADAWYRRAIAASPGDTAYLHDRASCLIELNRLGEAEEMLTRAHSLGPTPAVLEQIAYVAAKKGEYPRAEAACNAALEMDAAYAPALLTLGAICAARFRWDETAAVLRRLDALSLDEGARRRRGELRARYEEAVTRLIPCASCGRVWRVSPPPEPVKAIRLFAMPPDELPAGTCPHCGKTWCIGCAKQFLDDSGRFLCPVCGRSLKLSDEGLKKLVCDWAEREMK
ncbi:MAG: tetratricopeptide repeat protein [Treponema sp.]|jgi:tetratricopeptide (TPR) repeat protein|nr:tetratricopeptide repeat protein [Treponema sp.]